MSPVRSLMLAVSALVLVGSLGNAVPGTSTSFVRVRLVVTSASAVTDVRVEGASIASYVSTVLAGPPLTRTSQLGQTLRLSTPATGASVEGQFDIILETDVDAATVIWNVMSGDAPGEKTLEVYDLNDFARPRLVDRFSFDAPSARLTTRAAQFGARLHVTPFTPSLVIAQFYVWYTRETWLDPQFIDHPVPRYSTDALADMVHVARAARDAGVDALAISWKGGRDAAAAEHDRRMRTMLEAGRAVGVRMAVTTETVVANGTNDPNLATDPQVFLEWLEDIVDRYGSHPAYLRVGGRPVVFVYSASRITTSDWTTLMARFRAGGRTAFIVGDFFHSTLLEPFDGEYQYINADLSADRLAENYRIESARVRTFSLLRPNDRRRLWVASVCPGYDDSHLVGRETPLKVDRRDGATYDTQWSTAIASAADWVMITSWNEWWENTAIEPGELYGGRYVDRTRLWASRFKRTKLVPDAAAGAFR